MHPDELKAARQRMHLTQQELADRLGLSKATIENYEAGNRRDKKPVEIPRHVELACHALSLELAAEKSSMMYLTTTARNQARMAMYFASLPCWVGGNGNVKGEFPTNHAFHQASGDIPSEELSLLDMLFPHANPIELRRQMYALHNSQEVKRRATDPVT